MPDRNLLETCTSRQRIALLRYFAQEMHEACGWAAEHDPSALQEGGALHDLSLLQSLWIELSKALVFNASATAANSLRLGVLLSRTIELLAAVYSSPTASKSARVQKTAAAQDGMNMTLLECAAVLFRWGRRGSGRPVDHAINADYQFLFRVAVAQGEIAEMGHGRSGRGPGME